MSYYLSWIIIAILVLCYAFFASGEVAYNASNRVRLKKNAEEGGFRDKLALSVYDHYNKMLSTILVGTNVTNFIISALATLLFIRLLKDKVGGEEPAALIATVCITAIILVFGEILPKTIAKSRCETYAPAIALPLRILMTLLTPITAVIGAIVKLISLPLRKKMPDTSEEPSVTEDELVSIIETGEDEGSIDENRSELLQSAIEFSDTSVQEIIVPRVDMTAFDIGEDPEEIVEIVENSPYSRIPVYEDSIDNIIGFLYVNRFLKALTEKKPEDIDIREMLIEPCFMHKTVKLPMALDELRRQKKHMAIVIDEYGGTMGIVTMEDILEELVGDIWDESDTVDSDVVPIGKDTYEINGDMSVYDFLESMQIDDSDFESEYTTVGGWAIEMLDGFPHEGDSFDYKNLSISVDEMDEHRILKLTVQVQPEKEDKEEE